MLNGPDLFKSLEWLRINGSGQSRKLQPWGKTLTNRPDRNAYFDLMNSNVLNYTIHPLIREYIMSKGTVKWFDAGKGFGFIT
ncbi:MAG TPA: cold-shock protein, partial [Candidatus Thioglobus sp.]|nr:cold-shock protein [Candidatus Thioglobus sp.]